MPASADRLAELQRKIWSGSIPLEIRLAPSDCRTYDDSDPYLVQMPRLSYLAFLLPRLHAFFAPSLIKPDVEAHDAWLAIEGVPLKWHYPLGLLYDLYSGAELVNLNKDDTGSSQPHDGSSNAETTLPWRLTIQYTDHPGDQLMHLDSEGRALLDSFVNAVKEADFIRNGSAKTVMSMSKADSDSLWRAVQTHDLLLFNTINTKLLNPPGIGLRHVPLKIYLPTSAQPSATADDAIAEEAQQAAGHIRVVQALIPLHLPSSRQPQTLGTALNATLPSLFPSRRNPLLAQPVLHGVAVPMAAPMEELARAAAYPDGFLHVAVAMLG